MSRIKKSLIILAASILCMILCSTNSNAADYSSMMKKWMFTQYYQCIKDSDKMEDEIQVRLHNSSESVLEAAIKNKGKMYLPSYKLAGADSLKCLAVAKGASSLSNGAKGAIEYGEHASDSSITFNDPQGLTKLLTERLPYQGSGQDSYFSIRATEHTETTKYGMIGDGQTSERDGESSTVNINATRNSNGKLVYTYDDGWGNWANSITLDIDYSANTLKISLDTHWLLNAIGGSICTSNDGKSEAIANLSDTSIEETYNNVKNALRNITWHRSCTTTTGIATTMTVTRYDFVAKDIINNSDTNTFTYDSSKVDASISAHSGFGGHSGAAFNNTDFYNLYKFYLDKVVPSDVQNAMTCNPTDTTNLTKVKLLDAADKTFKDCYINFNGQWDSIKSTTVYTQDNSAISIVTITMEGIVNWFNKVDTSTIDINAIDGTTDSNIDPDEDSTEAERKPDCHTNAGALGWIICPTITMASNAVEKVYTDLIEPYLQIDAVLFDTTTDGGKAVQSIWGIFQGFANLVFVMIFLFVIFSQLTGAGIDNYGIKKILPKLIVSAILINLSYIICQLAVDLSNILGRAVGSLFENLGSDLNGTISNLSVNLNKGKADSVPKAFPAGTLIIVGVASVLGVSAFLSAGFAIIIPALIALLSLVVGVMFLFILLALRQAIAVILVVVSPMAFAAYILPNTKKLFFDKWFEAFKGMLIAYPVCAALVYGGDFVSKILLVTEVGNDSGSDLTSLGIILSAAAIAVAPIFFIPSVIKKGMNGVADLGNRVGKLQGGIGGNATKRANDRLQASWLTDSQNRKRQELGNRTQARRNEKNARVAKRRLNGGRISRGIAAATGGVFGGGLQGKVNRKGIAKLGTQDRAAYQDANSTINAQDKQMTDLYDQTFATMGIDDLENQLTKMGNSGKMDANMMQAAINRIGQMDQGEAIKAMSKLSNSKAFKNMGDKDRNRVIQTCLSQKGNPLLKAYAKQLGVAGAKGATLADKNISFDTFASSNAGDGMGGRLRDMGNNVFSDMDKDVMEYIANSSAGIADMFSNGQMAAAYAQGFSGATGTQFGKVIQSRDSSAVINDLGSMKTQQVANINGDTINHLVGKVGRAGVRTALSGQISELNKKENAEMRAGMSQGTRTALGIA